MSVCMCVRIQVEDSTTAVAAAEAALYVVL